MPGGQNSAGSGGYDRMVDPGSVNPPGVIEPAASFTNGIPQLWVAASGGARRGFLPGNTAAKDELLTILREINAELAEQGYKDDAVEQPESE